MTVPVLGTIIIAAHNEQLVIERCLRSLAPILAAETARVVVVCNGCSDNTADLARRFYGVTVLELPVASKTGALRAGDLVATEGPRIYLDADITMTARAAVEVLLTLRPGGPLAARPPVDFDCTGSQWAVRSWYRVRAQLPSIHEVLWGAGSYALSVEGRARFIEFPDIVSDDLFIDQLMAGTERAIVPTDPLIVRAPRSSTDLLKILKRTYRTQNDVTVAPSTGVVSAGQRGQLDDLRALLRRDPSCIPDVAVYVALISIARMQARWAPASARWERDNSSREVIMPHPTSAR